MNVLQWGPLPTENDKGGVESYIKRLSNELIHRGHDVDVATFGFGTDAGKARATNVPKRSEYDLIHVHLGLKGLGVLSPLWKRLAKAPLVFTIHIVPNPTEENVTQFRQSIIHWLGYYTNKIVAKQADAITAVSNYSSKRGEESYDVVSTVIPNAVDVDRFRPTDKDSAKLTLSEINNFPEKTEQDSILYLGNLIERKGIDTLINAFPGIVDECPDTDLLIGGGGYYEDELKELARATGEFDSIHFLGHVPEDAIIPLYTYADIFALPTRGMEGMPTTALEAMATETPVVCTNVGGLKEIINSGETGVIVDSTSESVADGVCKLLCDARVRKQIAKASRAYVEQNHQWHVIAADYESKYHDTIESD